MGTLARRTMTLAALAGLATRPARAAMEFRICLDTPPYHIRNITLRRFVALIDQRLPGRFHFRVFESGQLYNDRDAIKGLLWADMEMAVPTIFQVARFVPDANITSLPMFYGLSPDVLYPVLDRTVIPLVAQSIERKLAVHVLKPALDLGYVHVFATNRSLTSSASVRGLKVRVPGGAGNVMRMRSQGAFPVVIPWSESPLALSQGNIDGIATTYETLQSGALWDVGIRYGYEEGAVFVQYVPMLRRDLWETFDNPTRDVFSKSWLTAMIDGRALAIERQLAAKIAAVSHGVQIAEATSEQRSAERERLGELQKELAERFSIAPNVLVRTQASIDNLIS